jgi:photosystem II stability/assembly factor-like uncharacterized protein
MQALLALPHEDGMILYVGTEDYGLYHSLDGGGSWRPLLEDIGINALAAFPDAERLLAATDKGIFFAEDGGVTWQPAQNGEHIALSLAVNGAGQVIAATWQEGVCLSEDGGRSWQRAEARSLAIHAPPLAVLTPAGEIFAADLDGGWSYSTDEGASWQPVDVALETPISALIGSNDDEFVLMAGSGQTLFRRCNEEDWEALDLPLTIAQLAISSNYNADSTLFIADEAGALHRSTGDGAIWQRLSPPWDPRTLLTIHIAPTREDLTLYAVTAQARNGKFGAEVWRSLDGGESWFDLAGFEVDAPVIPLLALDDAERSLFLATQNRLIRLYNNADGELAVDQQFLDADVRITALAARTGTVYAASNRGVWQRNADGSIHPLGQGLEDEIVVAVLPGKDEIYAVTLGGGVWKK